MGDVVRFPPERRADMRIDLCNPPEQTRSDGTLPPHDLDAEAAVLSACSLDKDRLATVLEILKPEHFYSEANARIFQAMQQLTIAETPVDIVSLATWLRGKEWLAKVGGTAYLAHLADATPAPGNVQTHAEIVLALWRLRMLIATCHRIAAEARPVRAIAEAEAFIASARAGFEDVTRPRKRLVGAPIHAAVEQAREHVREATSGVVVGVRYPWRSVAAMVGMLVQGRQTVLAGLSEHGKTAAAMQIAACVATTKLDDDGFGEAVYVLSGEMPAKTLMLRTACSFAGVDVLRVESGFAHPDELRAVAEQFDFLASLPIVIDDKPGTPSDVAGRVKGWQAEFLAGRAHREARTDELQPGETHGATRLHHRCRMRLAIGDHAQQLQRFMPQHQERERIAQTAIGWDEEIAKGCNVATLLLSQLRQVEPERAFGKGPSPAFVWPQESHLFGAPTEIKASADTVLAITRPELMFRSKMPAKWKDVAAITRLKSRFGGTARRVLLAFDRGLLSENLPAAARCEDDDE